MVNLARRRSNSIRRFDWTQHQISSDFQKSTRDDVDWKASPLGPMLSWPSSLRQLVLLAMADSTASAVIWGPTAASAAIIYNEPFAINHRHPTLLQGQALGLGLADHCANFHALYDATLATGTTQITRGQRLRQDRLGFVEERAYTWKLIPIIGDGGDIAGALVNVEDEDKLPPRRERSKSAVREIGNTLKGVIDRTAHQTATNAVRLHAHFSGSSCDCEKLWDITEQLEMHEARYERFADYAPVGIAALDRDYQVDWANKAYYDVMAQPSESKSFMSHIHPEDAAMVQGYFAAGAFKNDAWTFECRLKKSASFRAAVSPSETPRPLDNSPAWVLVSAYRENDKEHHTMAWIIDITAHKQAEDILRKRINEAVVAKAQKERFIDQICHEIRNPLSAMMHCTDDIIEHARSNAQEWSQDILEAAQNVSYCTQHIQDIVGDVLMLSKLDSNLIEICAEPTQPLHLVQEALNIYSREFKAEAIELQLKPDSSLTELNIDWLLFDPRRTLQVLMNLFTNAIKVVKGRAERKITVRLRLSAKQPCHDSSIQCVLPRQLRHPVKFREPYANTESVYLTIDVEDTGPGLQPDEMASLFERFAEENPKTESKYGGSGLGLFISRDLTELQGGRIGVGSKPGIGSKFVFSVEAKRIPCPTTKPEPISIEMPIRLRSAAADSPKTAKPTRAEDQSSEQAKEQSVPLAQKETKLSILIVEDNLINQKVLVKQLRKRGYQVQCANHGEEALEILQMSRPPPRPSLPTPASSQASLKSIKRKPVPSAVAAPSRSEFDVVLMDVEMPIMNGLTCTRKIRAYEASQNSTSSRIPIIAVTANARSEHGVAALDSGMDAITTKPYKIDELIAQINRYCQPQT